jgi:hypothetical protein
MPGTPTVSNLAGLSQLAVACRAHNRAALQAVPDNRKNYLNGPGSYESLAPSRYPARNPPARVLAAGFLSWGFGRFFVGFDDE